MSCLTQHKTKEELSNWLMENASDNETTGFLDMLAGDIWSMMNAEEELDEENDCDQDPTPEEAEWVKGFMGEIEKLKKENKKLERANEINADLHKTMEETIGELENENKKLKQKATAWDIINRGDWEYVRDLCDKEMCKDLIACGECKEEDFEGYECYEEEEEVVQDINGKNLKIPTEEELKVLGVSREEFIMLAKQSDCAY